MIRGVTELDGLRDIKTVRSFKKRSIPKSQSSVYLELYMLKKERDRLEKEVNILEKRKKSSQKRINEIDSEMGRLGKEETKRRQASSGGFKKLSEKNWKTISLKY